MNQHAVLKHAANNALGAFQPRPGLQGEGYINWLRCSNPDQADTSPDGQKTVNDAFAGVCGMRWAGYDVYADGVSGSQTFNREDIAEIIRLKKTRNDFTKVVVFELGRATRGGIRHGNVVEDELKKAGIELISSTELIPDGPLGELIKAVKHFGNQQQAQNISKSVARGLAISLAKAQRPASAHTQYGLDRMYVGPSGVERALVRWDGEVQLRLDPLTGKEVGRAIRQPWRKPRRKGKRRIREGHSRFVGYVKQPDETSMLVKGAEDKLETVRWAWEKRYFKNWGTHQIVADLNRRGVPSPRGGIWHLHSIQYILENPIYLGVEVRHRWTKSLYHKLGTDGPIPVFVNQDELEEQGRMAVPEFERPREEWVLVDVPKLKDILPPHVRQLALTRIMDLYDSDAVERRQKRKRHSRHKHDKSLYLLSGLLHNSLTEHVMHGDTVKKKLVSGEKFYRYYLDYSCASKGETGIRARHIPAKPLEDAVVPVVLDVLKDSDLVADRVRTYFQNLALRDDNGDQRRADLAAERKRVTRTLDRIYTHAGDVAETELAEMVAEHNKRLRDIRAELALLDARVEETPPRPEEAVATATAEINSMLDAWKELPPADLKVLLAAFVEDLSVDPATLAVSFTVRLPEKIPQYSQPEGRDELGVRNRLLWPSVSDPNPETTLKIDHVACDGGRRGRCYQCKRTTAAA